MILGADEKLWDYQKENSQRMQSHKTGGKGTHGKYTVTSSMLKIILSQLCKVILNLLFSFACADTLFPDQQTQPAVEACGFLNNLTSGVQKDHHHVSALSFGLLLQRARRRLWEEIGEEANAIICNRLGNVFNF